jgi:hypothetical protein
MKSQLPSIRISNTEQLADAQRVHDCSPDLCERVVAIAAPPWASACHAPRSTPPAESDEKQRLQSATCRVVRQRARPWLTERFTRPFLGALSAAACRRTMSTEQEAVRATRSATRRPGRADRVPSCRCDDDDELGADGSASPTLAAAANISDADSRNRTHGSLTSVTEELHALRERLSECPLRDDSRDAVRARPCALRSSGR